MKKLLVATKNTGKLKEYERALKDFPVQLVLLSDLHIVEDIEEDGETYKENSQKKALFFSKLSGLPTLADDSGLEIDALHGQPGVRSKRWLGHEATDEELVAHMEKIAKTIPKDNNGALYRAVVSFALPDGRIWTDEATIRGVITQKSKEIVIKGFPYDIFFYVPALKKYYEKAMLSEEEHKQYNHRYKAIQKLKSILIRELEINS